MTLKRPTLKDVCREAMVSEATVSRVLNKSPLVHQQTRERVLEVMRRLGYTPNAAARNLSRSKTDVIGVIFHQMSSGFFASVMSGIDQGARDHGFHILSAFTHHGTEADRTCSRLFEEMRIDGMLILDPGLDEKLIESLKKHRRPIVLIQREIKDPSISSISVDNRGGARAAMQHLLSLGYRDLLVVKGPEGAQDARQRVEGCKQALSAKEHPRVACRYIEGHYNPHDALLAFRADRQRHGLPRAVFALNDAMALSILKELQETGVKVPEQVAVVGFDGIEAADYVGLTTIETPMADLGEGAVRLIVKHLQSPEEPAEHIRLETKLVIRKTCGEKTTSTRP